MASCVSRVLGAKEQISGTSEFLFRTTECGAAAARKIVIDDGDASFGICAACFKRFLTKGTRKADTWWGWFDCEIPAHAPVKGSKWYQDVVKKAWEEYTARQAASVVQPAESGPAACSVQEEESEGSDGESEDNLDDLVASTAALSIKEQIEKNLEAAQAVAKQLAASGKTTKELLDARRKVFDLKKQLMLL